MKKNIFTSREAAAVLGVSQQTIKNKVKEGLFKPLKTESGRLRFKLNDLKRYGPIDLSALESIYTKPRKK